jgi:hypothetical protein
MDEPIAPLIDSLTDESEDSASAEHAASSVPRTFAITLDAAKGPLASYAWPRLPFASAADPSEPTAAPAPDLTPARAEADDGSGLRTAGYVAGGVGLVGIALFAIAGIGAKSAYDKLDSDCGTTACTDEAHQSDIEGGKMLQTTANIGLAAGLVGLGVGATLLVLGSRSSDKREPTASVSTNGGMITCGGRF